MPVAAPTWAPLLGEGRTGLAEALDALMWIVQVEYNGFGHDLVIRGYVKPPVIPPEETFTEGKILAGFADSTEEIFDVLDQADFKVVWFNSEVDTRNGLEMQLTLTIQEIT